MTDLIHVLPDFDTAPFSHILPSLERALITANDLLTLEPLDVARRAQVPWVEVEKLSEALINGFHTSFHKRESCDVDGNKAGCTRHVISLLDPRLDDAIGGGIPTGQLTEIVGESAAGKTQFLLSLSLAVQLPPPYGPGKTALYITTEAPLQTSRLHQILDGNNYLARLDASCQPDLTRIQSIKVDDLDSQEHVLRYQVPVAIARSNVGLLIIDSIAANFRAEFNQSHHQKSSSGSRIQALHDRSQKLIRTGAWLRHLAQTHNIAIVVANQVLDRFTSPPSAAIALQNYVSQPSQSHPQSSAPSSPPSEDAVDLSNVTEPQTSRIPQPQIHLSTPDPLALDHQQRFFSGWGDDASASGAEDKTPSLGMTWTNQLSARIVLLRRAVGVSRAPTVSDHESAGTMRWERYLKIAFSAWCADANGHAGSRFEITTGGVVGVVNRPHESG